MKNTNNSILFSKIARETLSEMFPLSKRTYILEKASNYEVMHFLLKNKFPSEMYNSIKEEELYREFKLIVLENFTELSSFLGKDSMKSIIFEVTPISDTLSKIKKGAVEAGEKLKQGTNVAKNKLSDSMKTVKKGIDVVKKEFEGKGQIQKQLDKNILEPAAQKRAEDLKANIKKAEETIERNPALKAQKEKEKREKLYKTLGAAGAAGAIATAIGFGAHKLYQKHKENKKEAIKQKITSLQKGLKSCKISNDPENCRRVVELKIKALNDKL